MTVLASHMAGRTTGGVELAELWRNRRANLEARFAADAYDRARDAKSEARYDDGTVEVEPDLRADPAYWNGAEA